MFWVAQVLIQGEETRAPIFYIRKRPKTRLKMDNVVSHDRNLNSFHNPTLFIAPFPPPNPPPPNPPPLLCALITSIIILVVRYG